jgi:hypothetical protein
VLDDVVEGIGGGWGFGAALVVGAGLLALRGGRPLAKNAVRGWLTVSSGARELGGNAGGSIRGAATRLSDSARGLTANVVEQAQDLYAESKAEVAGRADRAKAGA